jgi:ribonuclease D
MESIVPITDTTTLAARCNALKDGRFILLDTEFIRERTYYSRLCLLQVGGEDGSAFCVDPLAEGMDLAPLLALLHDPSVLKVFHAGRQDLEIFFYLSGRLPEPIFDTQIAAQFAGYGESISYSELVRRTTNEHIDKGARFTDWSHRPLSARQLTYALDDVIHLRTAYLKLEKSGRLAWAEEEIRTLLDPSLYEIHPENAWERVKCGNLRPRQMAALMRIAEWREREAQTQDVPRGRILKDDALSEIASMLPESMAELKQLRTLQGASNKSLEHALALVTEVRALPQEQLPKTERKRGPEIGTDALQMLQMLLAIQCRRHGILPRLVATREELEALASGARPERPLSDWRGEMFGKLAVQMMEGKLSLSLDPASGEAVLR